MEISSKQNNVLGLFGIFLYFAIGDVYYILSSIGLGVEMITSYKIVGIIKYAFYSIILFKSINKIDINVLAGTLIYGIILSVSCLINDTNVPYVVEMISEFGLFVFPLIVIFLYIGEPEKILKFMRYSAYVVAIKVIILPYSSLYLETVNYMEVAYGSLIMWAVITYYGFTERGWLDIAFSIALSITYMIFSARGAVFCVIGYLAFCVLLFTQWKQRVFIYTMGIVSTTFLFAFFEDIFEYFVIKLDAYDLRSYTVTQVLNENFLNSIGREIIYEDMVYYILENPFGYGVGYDRVIGGSSGAYAHNIFLELYIAFGIGLGSIIIFLLLFMYAYMIIICKDKAYQALFSVFAIPGILMLQLSGSIFTSPHIFISVLIFYMYYNGYRKQVHENELNKYMVVKIKSTKTASQQHT